MNPTRIRWGIVSTIKAPLRDILSFAAHHLELGAHRLYIYLDDGDAETFNALKSHPKIRPILCDLSYWDKRGGRPEKHQVRQVKNANHAYRRKADVDWLGHIDVDEFLWPEGAMSDHLASVAPGLACARIRPIEAIAGDGTLFKGFIPPGPDRDRIVEALYPTYGRFVRGGFLSHVAGKLFVRTGLGKLAFRIHNVMDGAGQNLPEQELSAVQLCHLHARNWDDWMATYRYRLDRGSYREDLPATAAQGDGGLNLHALFRQIEARDGMDGLRAFYDELCADTPRLRAALDAQGLLRICDLDLDGKRRRHFPDNPV